jgi:hypothetical protein
MSIGIDSHAIGEPFTGRNIDEATSTTNISGLGIEIEGIDPSRRTVDVVQDSPVGAPIQAIRACDIIQDSCHTVIMLEPVQSTDMWPAAPALASGPKPAFGVALPIIHEDVGIIDVEIRDDPRRVVLKVENTKPISQRQDQPASGAESK